MPAATPLKMTMEERRAARKSRRSHNLYSVISTEAVRRNGEICVNAVFISVDITSFGRFLRFGVYGTPSVEMTEVPATHMSFRLKPSGVTEKSA